MCIRDSFYTEKPYPVYLYYNPHKETKTITYQATQPCDLCLPDLSDSGLSLREFPRAVCRYLLRAVRADGVVPFRQIPWIGE